jgi:hypothetical protein
MPQASIPLSLVRATESVECWALAAAPTQASRASRSCIARGSLQSGRVAAGGETTRGPNWSVPMPPGWEPT